MKLKQVLFFSIYCVFLFPPVAKSMLVDTLPPDFPEIHTEVYGETGEGSIFLSPVAPTPYKLFVLDNSGGVISFTEGAVGQRFLDFKKANDTTYVFHTDPGWGEPVYYLTDTLYNIVDSFRAGNGEVLDSHDIWLLENGRAYVIVYEIRVIDMSQVVTGGNPSAEVAGLTIQEVDNQQNVYWEWTTFDHFEVTDGISQGGSSLIDFTLANISYVHCNSLFVDEDDNILFSSRNLHEVTKIDRSTGDVIWRLGGQNNQFTFIDDPLNGFTDQHDAQWTSPNTLILFDNGNFHAPATNRAVEYEIDEVNMTATMIWEFQNPYGSKSLASGNVQRLPNGGTFIGWGIISPNDAPVITEVNADDEIVFELSFLNNGMPANQFTYRAFRFGNEDDGMMSANENVSFNKHLMIYPNPGSGLLRFTNDTAIPGNAQLIISDVQGRIVHEAQLSNFEIDASQLASGIYYYQIISQNEIYKGSFVIENYK